MISNKVDIEIKIRCDKCGREIIRSKHLDDEWYTLSDPDEMADEFAEESCWFLDGDIAYCEDCRTDI